MGSMFRQEHGFTITELMIAIVLVGLLSTIGLQSSKGSVDVARLNADILREEILNNH
jgi:prepilin-type N-terminal cleavage/methylation domain-containing protein